MEAAPRTLEPGLDTSNDSIGQDRFPVASGLTLMSEGIKVWLWVQERRQDARTTLLFHPSPFNGVRKLINSWLLISCIPVMSHRDASGHFAVTMTLVWKVQNLHTRCDSGTC